MKNLFIILFFLFFYSNNYLFAIDFGSYLAGQSALNKNDNKSAIYYFENAIDLKTIDTEYGKDVAKKLCTLYLLEGQIKECIVLAKEIEKDLNPDDSDNTSILMALIVSDIKEKNYNSALKRLKNIKKSSYERFSVPIIEAWLISEEKKNLKKAKQKLDELETDLVINGLRNLNLALIHELFNKEKEALIYYEKAINAYTQPSYRLAEISANAFERNENFEKAKDIYIKFNSSSNDNLLIEESLKRIEKRIIPKKMIKNTSDGIAELFSTIASSFSSDFTNNFSIIYTHFALYLKKDFEVANLYLAELLENNQRFIDANNIYKKIDSSSNFFWHSRLKNARNLELLGENNKSISILKKMSNEKKNRHDSLKLLGDIYKNNNKYNDAIRFYDEVVLRIGEIETRHWEILYSRGIAYERNKQWDNAEKDFLKILELIPDQPDVLNYLGYSWIEKDINLEQAKDFVLKAAGLRPSDPYIVDSLGWAYFSLKEYDKAVEELERAVSLKPTDPIINDHLGDAYYKINRKLEALYQWKKALDFKPDEELRKKIEKKIENNEGQLDFL